MLVALALNDNGRPPSSHAASRGPAQGSGSGSVPGSGSGSGSGPGAASGPGATLATERQRLALQVPLELGAAPPSALRRRHELGVCVATSTVAVERDRGPLRWRASVTLWELADDARPGGKHVGQAEAVARHLVRRLLDGVGEGEAVVERSGVSGGGTTFFARKLLTGEEARVVRTFQGPAPMELSTAL